MRRTIVLIALLLLAFVAGAIVNIALAWGLYVYGPMADGSRLLSERELLQIEERFGAPSKFAWSDPPGYRGRGWMNAAASMTAMQALQGEAEPRVGGHEIWEMQAGWPARALVGQVWVADNSVHGLLDLQSMRWNIPYLDAQPRASHVPCTPLWPGFAINTLLYALLLMPLFIGPRRVRRMLRRRRGLCPACAYPVGVSATCTECGQRLAAKSDAGKQPT